MIHPGLVIIGIVTSITVKYFSLTLCICTFKHVIYSYFFRYSSFKNLVFSFGSYSLFQIEVTKMINTVHVFFMRDKIYKHHNFYFAPIQQ